MTQYPLQFTSETVASAGAQTLWNTQSVEGISHCCIPTEFSGPGGALSPEDLYNHALTNCFLATFKIYAENSKLEYGGIKVNSRLVVDLDENKKPIMKEFFLKDEISAVNHPDRALLLAKKAASSGFILNSVKTECHFDFVIV